LVDTITLNGRGLQGCILHSLRGHFETTLSMPNRIVFSLRKLGIGVETAAIISANLLTALSRLPLPVVAAFVKAAMNGWTTSHRIDFAVGRCPFCKSIGGDSMAVGLRCVLTSGLVLQLLPRLALPPEVEPLVVMLSGTPMPQLTVLGLAIVVDCLHSAMMSARFGGTSGDGRQVAEARFRTLCVFHSQARSVVLALR
jgi:hypothetical protein